MNETVGIALIVAAGVGLFALLLIVGRQRREAEAHAESPFAASTEGLKVCPKCGMGNLWTDRNCVACGSRLPG